MKRLVFAALALVAAVASAEMKIGTVDMMLLVRNHPDYGKNRKYLRDTEQDYQKELDQMQDVFKELQDEGQAIARNIQNPVLSDAARQKDQKRIAEIERRLVEQQQAIRKKAVESQDQLSRAEARLLRYQADDLKKRIAKFAEENGYDLVLDGAAAVYNRGSTDVTDEILKAMGVDPEKARSKASDGGDGEDEGK